MGKIFDRLFVEFLIPALLMFLCILLVFDIAMGNSFDLINASSRKVLADEPYLLAAGILFAYLLNTSLSAVLNLTMRAICWGKIREYLMLRKLNAFKTGPLKGLRWWNYLRLTPVQRESLESVLKPGAENFYSEFMQRMEAESISAKSVKDLVDAYDTLRATVMDSGDSAIIEWIQYHWSQLRLARSCIVPAFLLIILMPMAIHQWGGTPLCVLGGGIGASLFFILQWMHYYYRERFMIYAMISFFLRKPGRNENTRHSE